MSNFNIKKFLIENKITTYSKLFERSRYSNSQIVRDAEVEFQYNGDTYSWYGDYEITTSGESSDYDYPGDNEGSIDIFSTDELLRHIPSENDVESVEPTPEILDIVASKLGNY